MILKISIPHSSYLILALSYFTVLVNPLGWHMMLHVSPIYLVFIFLSIFEKKTILVRSDKLYVISLFFFVIFTLISVVFISDQSGAWGKVLRHSIELICLYFFLCYCKGEPEIKFLTKAYLYSVFAIVLKMLIQRYSFPDAPGRYSIFNFNKAMDPNFLASLFIFPVILSFYQCLKYKFRIKNVLTFFILVIAVAFTGSRGGIFGIGLGCIVLWFFEKKRSITTIAFTVLGIMMFIFVIVVLPETISRFDIRTFNDGSNMLRFNLWKTCWKIFLSSPIVGRGGNSMLNLGPQYGAYLNLLAHNTFLDILSDYGVIGFSLYYIGPTVLILKGLKEKNILVSAVMIGTFGTAFFISASDSVFWWQNYMFCIVLLRHMKEKSLVVENYIYE